MYIDIIGAGALGLLYGAKLCATGQMVRFWTRSHEQARELCSKGITLSLPDQSAQHIAPESFEVHPLTEWRKITQHAPARRVMLMTKQGALKDILQVLRRSHERELEHIPVQIVCFQNGAGHIALITQELPKAIVFQAVTTEGARKDGNRHVIHAGRGLTEIGLSSSGEMGLVGEESIMQWQQMLHRAGFQSRKSQNIQATVYRKLLINAVINPLTAIWRIPNGDLLKSAKRIQLMQVLYDEGISVYDACGIGHEDVWWDHILDICRATAQNRSSMLTDIEAGRATEICAINGHVVFLAEQAGIETPLHSTMIQLIEGFSSEGRN